MNNLAGTQTLENLARAFAGESQARNRYTFFASCAKKEGHQVLEKEFKLIADNELAHAKVFYDLLLKGMGNNGSAINVNIEAGYPFELGDTLANLKASEEGETQEHQEVYPAFAEIAKKEGFPEIEQKFRMVARVEAEHAKKYNQLKIDLEQQKLYKKDKPTVWICTNCGHLHEGLEAPEVCPLCQHAKGWFEEQKQQ